MVYDIISPSCVFAVMPKSSSFKVSCRQQRHPYVTRSAPSSTEHYIENFDPSPVELKQLQKKLETDFHLEKKIATFDPSSRSWIEWFAPIQVLRSGAMKNVSPRSYATLPGYIPPLCPHAANPFRLREQCEMKVKYVSRLGYYFYIDPSKHQCRFKIRVPRDDIEGKKYIMNQKDYEAHAAAGDTEEENENDRMYSGFNSPIHESILACSAARSSQSSSSVSEIARGLFNFSPTSNQSYSPPTSPSPCHYSGSGSGSSGRPKPRPSNGFHLKSFFTQEAADQRARSDNAFFSEFIAQKEQVRPDLHPANKLQALPACLAQYEHDKGNRTFAHLNNLHTDVGDAIRALNSTIGIPASSVELLDCISKPCPSCMCVYSPLGYNDHVQNGRCMNTPSLAFVSTVDVERVPPVNTRIIPESQDIFSYQEYLDTAVGRAWLEWHSRIGVPMDVWWLISTATVTCEICGLARTFEGDINHRQGAQCADPQSAASGTLTRWKGKAKA
ncbi:hypothetical protein BDQ17DRAFT_1419032 [Cyathus striatus]|nr:hypothetical protein BDQ17DRAFT_1431893 [Cyathus striatus]KAF9014110.1 hypothetical protein BDQ17DRAFT_1419032 [Cyathus striatus]